MKEIFDRPFATNVEFKSAGEIHARVPAGTPGEADIVVQNPDGARSATPVYLTYTLPPPELAGITLGAGVVDIWGANFQQGAVAQFDGTDAVTRFASPNHLAVQAVGVGPAEVSVKVTNPDGKGASLTALLP